MLLSDFILELKQQKRSPKTICQYRADIRGFLCYVCREWANKSVLELGKKDFRRFSLHLIDDCKVSNARHNRLMTSIRSMMDYAESDDDLDYQNNAVRKVKGLGAEPVREIVFLSDDMILKLCDKLTEQGEYQKAALLMLAYDSAARRGELSLVEKESFLSSPKNSTNKVKGKGKKTFNLLYFSGTKRMVESWLQCRGDDDIESLWTIGNGSNKRQANTDNLYQWFTEMRPLITELGGPGDDFTPHSMRHSALTNYGDGTHYVCREMGRDGFPIEKLRLIAHHDSVGTTQSYLPNTDTGELESMFGIKIS
jgi:integrase/recombinase XerD